MPNVDYSGRTAPLTSKCCILYIYSTNICTENFKHCIYSPFFPLQNVVCFINLTYLFPVLFTFLYTGCAKIKKNNSSAKRLIEAIYNICKSVFDWLSYRIELPFNFCTLHSAVVKYEKPQPQEYHWPCLVVEWKLLIPMWMYSSSCDVMACRSLTPTHMPSHGSGLIP